MLKIVWQPHFREVILHLAVESCFKKRDNSEGETSSEAKFRCKMLKIFEEERFRHQAKHSDENLGIGTKQFPCIYHVVIYDSDKTSSDWLKLAFTGCDIS